MPNVTVSENARLGAKKYQIKEKFNKQIRFLGINPRHNSLDFKPLKSMSAGGIWRFRIDKHYWGLAVRRGANFIEVYQVIKHLK